MIAILAALALILPVHTPGVRNVHVTQATLERTVCVSGYSATIRPPAAYTSRLKRLQLVRWRYADRDPSHYEEDHLISLSLGGSPRAAGNLWPEPWSQARHTDELEWSLHEQLCAGAITLRQAQVSIIAWKRTHG